MKILVDKLPEALTGEDVQVGFNDIKVTALSVSRTGTSVSIVEVAIPAVDSPRNITPQLYFSDKALQFPQKFRYVKSPDPTCQRVNPTWAYILPQSPIKLFLKDFPGVRDLSELSAQFEWAGGSTLVSSVKGIAKVKVSVPDHQVQDLEVEILTPLGSNVIEGTVAIRVFNRRYLTSSALCRGFVFANPRQPRVSEVSALGVSHVNSISVGMTTSVTVRILIENAQIDIALGEISVLVDESEVNIQRVELGEESNKVFVSFETNSVDSE
jgi:copper chaperone CopZ